MLSGRFRKSTTLSPIYSAESQLCQYLSESSHLARVLQASATSRAYPATPLACHRNHRLQPTRSAPFPRLSTAPRPTPATRRGFPGETTVCLPWAAIHMGDTPGYRRGDTLATPALLGGGSLMPGAPGSPHCLKIGHSTNLQPDSYSVWEYMTVFVECGGRFD